MAQHNWESVKLLAYAISYVETGFGPFQCTWCKTACTFEKLQVFVSNDWPFSMCLLNL